MARKTFIAGNWKMNLTRRGAAALARDVAAAPAEGIEVGVAPPFVYLDAVSAALGDGATLLGAQDAYFEANGAFTGEISVDMLRDLNVKFCLAGHSERRHVLKESGELIAKKSAAIYAGGLTLIHCVGETMEQRDAGTTLAVIEKQLAELSPSSMDNADRLVIAYEPVWAIGTGRIATDAQAQDVHAFIRGNVARRWNPSFADAVRIQYGGSVKPENCNGLMQQADVDGALVGGASLKADAFLGIVRAAMN